MIPTIKSAKNNRQLLKLIQAKVKSEPKAWKRRTSVFGFVYYSLQINAKIVEIGDNTLSVDDVCVSLGFFNERKLISIYKDLEKRLKKLKDKAEQECANRAVDKLLRGEE